MPPSACELAPAICSLLRTCNADEVRDFSIRMADHGGTLPGTGDYVVPALAVLVALGKAYEQLLAVLPSPATSNLGTSLRDAVPANIGTLAAAARAALSSENKDAAIRSSSFIVSTPTPHVTDRGRYEALLQAAAHTLRGQTTEEVRVSCQQSASNTACCDKPVQHSTFLLSTGRCGRGSGGTTAVEEDDCTCPALPLSQARHVPWGGGGCCASSSVQPAGSANAPCS
jgi:hypothetical protein